VNFVLVCRHTNNDMSQASERLSDPESAAALEAAAIEHATQAEEKRAAKKRRREEQRGPEDVRSARVLELAPVPVPPTLRP
jgi:hypothetical protein